MAVIPSSCLHFRYQRLLELSRILGICEKAFEKFPRSQSQRGIGLGHNVLYAAFIKDVLGVLRRAQLYELWKINGIEAYVSTQFLLP